MSSGFAPHSRGEPDGDCVPVICQTGVQCLVSHLVDDSTEGDSTAKPENAGNLNANVI